MVACRNEYKLVLSEDGKVYAKGSNLSSIWAAENDKPDIFNTREGLDTNYKQVTWFTLNKLKVLDVKDGFDFSIFLCEKEDGKRELYGFGKAMRETYNGDAHVWPNRFGTNAKAVYGECIHQIVDVDANMVASFACTHDSAFYLMKGDEDKKKSIIPEKPDATGLIHFWK